jgi:bla regulator protein blaR1
MDAELLRALQPGIVALGWTLIDFLWQGALIAAAYAALRGLLRAPRARLFAGHVALLALAIAPLATLFSYLNAMGGDAAAQPLAANLLGLTVSATPDTASVAPVEVSPSWLWWLVALWAGGVLLLSLRLWREWRRLQRLCDHAEPLDAEWQRRFAQLRARLNVRLQVRLLQGVRIATPMLVGVLRPTILLPASLVARMPVDQLELILVHELAHLRRLDPLFNLLQTALDTLLFYHPGVHWISRKVREDRELCCDEIVVASGGDRLRYARALLALAEQRTLLLAHTPALAASGGALMERVERIVEVPAAPRSHTRALVVMALLGVLVMQWWLPARERADQANRAAMPLSLGTLSTPSALAAPALEIVIGDIATRLRAPLWTPPPFETPTIEAETGASDPLASIGAPDIAPASALAAPRDETTVATPTATLASAAPAALQSAPPVATPTPTPTIRANAIPTPERRIAPAYPRAARLAGVEGWVVLNYRIERDGSVAAIEVADSEPAGMFETAAQRALERWRYAPGSVAPQRLSQRFDFVLPDEESGNSRRDFDRCRQLTGSRVCRPMHAQLSGRSLTQD